MKKHWWTIYSITILAFLIIVYGGNRAVEVVAENIPVPREHCLILDAGHGGVDGGATSCSGILESSINLEITLKLRDLFHLLGYKTRSIRTTDISVYTNGTSIAQKKISDLRERLRIVETTPGAVLISIHQNTFSDSKYSGAQVFYAPSGESHAMARQMQQTFVAHLNPGSRRSEKEGKGIYLLEKTTGCGILIECGFLSNPEEEAMLRDPDYQKKICCIITASTACFLSNT